MVLQNQKKLRSSRLLRNWIVSREEGRDKPHPQKLLPEPDTAERSSQDCLEPFSLETRLLAKIWCVKMEKNAHKPNDLKCQLKNENIFEDTDTRSYESEEKRSFDEQLEGIEKGALGK